MMAEELPFCECGCGNRVARKGNRFIVGHNGRGIPLPREHCTKISKTMMGVPKSPEHSAAISAGTLGIPKSPEACTAMSKAHTGVPLSPEHCDAISKGALGIPKPPRTPEHCTNISAGKIGIPHTTEHIAAIVRGLEESDAVKAFRGGNDLVNHHYIYDHDDLSNNIVQMTRSDHTSLHNLLRKLNYIIPNYNLPDEPAPEARDEVSQPKGL